MEKSDHTEKNDQEEYALYTEKIVKRPRVKYRRLFLTVRFVAAAVLFGCIASAVMVFVNPWMQKHFPMQQEQRQPLEIGRDEFPSEAPSQQEEDESRTDDDEAETPAQGNQDENVPGSTLQKVIDSANASMVLVGSYRTDMENVLTGTESATETVGIVIGDANLEYIILTSYAAVMDSESIFVKFSDSIEVRASLLGADERTNIAVLAADKSEIPYYERLSVEVAQLDNSYMTEQGDMVVAAGRLYGRLENVDCGMVTGIYMEPGEDNTYEILSTGLAYQEGDYSYIFNMSGNVVGISNVSGDGQMLSVMGISDLKTMIEALSDGTEVAYFGVIGQNITSSMASAYGMPVGIYLTDVVVDSPAFEAGLQNGDIITNIDENLVLTIQSFSEKLYQCSAGQQIRVTVQRPDREEYRELQFAVTVSMR